MLSFIYVIIKIDYIYCYGLYGNIIVRLNVFLPRRDRRACRKRLLRN